MVSCPICATQNEGDFGLINCTSCGSPFFIQIDGSTEAAPGASASPNAGVPRVNTAVTRNTITQQITNDASDSILEDFAQSNRESDFNPIPSMPDNDVVQTRAGASADLPPPQASGQSMQDLADFGNSENSVAREGAYRFNLTVMGIDSAEIKTEVKDALSDGRFLWDIEAMFNEMADGVLVIKDLSAVKSALVVQRLKILPVDIKWEQHAIHQSV